MGMKEYVIIGRALGVTYVYKFYKRFDPFVTRRDKLR